MVYYVLQPKAGLTDMQFTMSVKH